MAEAAVERRAGRNAAAALMDKDQLWTLMPMAGVLVLGIFFALSLPRRQNEEQANDEEEEDDEDEEDEEDEEGDE
jgi:cbb3-type cytochrome oxidase subunit 3